MNISKKQKAILGICFVAACGTLYLWGLSAKKRVTVEPKKSVVITEINAAPEGEALSREDGSEGTETLLYVHVCGAVEKEGVYALSQASRVADAVAAAGGFSGEADTSYCNLAALLKDGQKVYIPTCKETEQFSMQQRGEAAVWEEDLSDNESGIAGNRKVNINTAGKEELMTLNGVGETKAENILLYRERVGRFQKIEDIKNVTGIGDAMFEKIKDSIITE